MFIETENIEFKSQFTEDIYKEVIAFANTDGGIVYVGIDDEGNAIGLDNADDEYTRITNGIRDAILPDVTMFVKYSIHDNRVVRITVSEGTNKPYYLKSKGLKPSGVYVRQGASIAQASYDQIRQMIKNTDGDEFEEERSLSQELSFAEATAAFARYGVEFNESKYLTLGLINSGNKIFTNLAWLLSDQCKHTTKVAVFGDVSNTDFKDHKEFGGSIFKQLEETFQYLKLCNRTKATFNGLQRVDKPDYPEEALREALLNALIHRDYSFSGSIIVNINDESIEFISLGGLIDGLSTDDIRVGISQPRNKNLAEVFHRLRLIESYGTGIRRIYNLYEGHEVQPNIDVTPNTFKITLPNMNLDVGKSKKPAEYTLTPQIERIVDYVRETGYITEPQIQDLVNVKKTRAYNIARQMCDEGIITSVGKGSYKKYLLNE